MTLSRLLTGLLGGLVPVLAVALVLQHGDDHRLRHERTPTPPAASSAGNYGSASTPESRAAFRNASNQRRQAAQTERAAAAQRALDALNTLPDSRAKIRAEMSQKYKVEF